MIPNNDYRYCGVMLKERSVEPLDNGRVTTNGITAGSGVFCAVHGKTI
jgi:hypothetical protein